MANVSKFILGLLCATALFGGGHSSAAPKATQPQSSRNGITISPFLQQIEIQQGDTEKTFNLKLANNSNTIQELNLSPRDFGSLNETGGVLLAGESKYTQKYGLTSWIKLGTNTVVLQPNESREVPVTIENRTSLQPGGHYAAVIVGVKGLDDDTGNHVAINQQLMSLILLNKQGGEHYALKLTSIQNNGNWLHLPSTVRLRFQNPGNVHVIPRGTVLLKSPNGKVLAKGIINSESAFVLPESFREMYVPLTKVSNDIPFPGLYHIEVNYRYDGINQTAQKSSTVQFINLVMYGLLAILILIIWRIVLRKKSSTKKTK